MDLTSFKIKTVQSIIIYYERNCEIRSENLVIVIWAHRLCPFVKQRGCVKIRGTFKNNLLYIQFLFMGIKELLNGFNIIISNVYSKDLSQQESHTTTITAGNFTNYFKKI